MALSVWTLRSTRSDAIGCYDGFDYMHLNISISVNLVLRVSIILVLFLLEVESELMKCLI